MDELWKTILGSSGIATVVVTLLTLGTKLWQNRRVGLRAEDLDDAEWNAAYKAGAEAHVLGYDLPMRQAVMDMQHDINNLLVQSGQERKQFPPIPDPREYPLFPKREGGDKKP